MNNVQVFRKHGLENGIKTVYTKGHVKRSTVKEMYFTTHHNGIYFIQIKTH